MLTPAVTELLRDTGFPGMKVLHFAFDSREDNPYLPHNYEHNCVVYLGTHDNDTTKGWLDSAPEQAVEYAKKYLRLDKDLVKGFIEAAMSCVGDTVIITVQDLLGLGGEARMNMPSTKENNWRFRVSKEYLKKTDAEFLRETTNTYFR